MCEFFRTTRVLQKGIQMAISSIHFAAGKGGYFAHNSRETPTKNAIFSDEKNYCSANKDEAFKIYRDELEIRTKAYLDNHPGRKKLHEKTITHLSAIFNFNHDTTVEQAQAVCQYLEKKLDTKVIQMSMHRDEGHHKKHSHTEEEQELHDLLKIKNYHGHIEMLGLDSQGNSIRRKLDKPMLRTIQTDVAAILGMERGRHTSYNKDEYFEITKAMPEKEEFASKEEYNKAFKEKAKELGLYKEPKAKRLDTYDYKKAKEMEAEAVARELAKAKDLQELNKKLREELKEQGATREDYAKLEQLNKELKEKIKEKDLTIDELNLKIDEYKQEKAPKTNEIVLDDKSIPEKEKEVLGSLKDDFQSELEANKKGLLGKSYEVKLKEEFSHSPNVESLTLFMRVKKKLTNAYDIIKAQAIKILNLETENKSLKKENDKLSRELREAELEIKELSKEEFKHYPLNSEKKDIATTPKAQSLEEILKSPVKKEAEAKENNPTYDIEAKAYKPKVKAESQIRKQGRGIG